MQNQIDIIQTTNFKIYIVPLCDHNMHGLILSHYAGWKVQQNSMHDVEYVQFPISNITMQNIS